MASTATASNISHMNQKQLKKLALDIGVNPVTVNATISNNAAVKATLITAIKAK